MTSYQDVSMWLATCGDDLTPREPLTQDITVDVAIIGAGYTGLWTAYYLKVARPDLKVAILEAQIAGFGASGRNGGWASALFPSSLDTLARGSSKDAALAQHHAMRSSVDEIIRVTKEHGIEAGITKGGTLTLARTPVQWERAKAEVEHARSWGRGEDDIVLLDAKQAKARLNATGVLGATYTPDCAAVQPAKLVRGLAKVVSELGVAIYEQTRVTAVAPHRLEATGGAVTADFVVRATEGYSADLPGATRAVIPVYSLMIATAPLAEETWEQIGLAGRETFTDHRHLIVYGQRTADGRLVFGGRGAPYHFGSAIRPEFDREPGVFAALKETLVEMLPAVADATITHQWGGPLGIARDWAASVGLDAATGMAWAGGYVGDGVTTTNLAGRTLRDLILGAESELTALPWVGPKSRAWEVEPLRWLGVNAGLKAMSIADAEERLTGRESLAARVMAPFMGGH